MLSPSAFFSYILLNVAVKCHAFTTTSFVTRVTLDEYLSSPSYDRPILIRDMATPVEIERLVDSLMSACGDNLVSLQRKQKHDDETHTEIYDVTLQESIEYMMDSNHNDSYFAFCEGLLSTSTPSNEQHKSLQELNQSLERMRDAPFPNKENWFDFFPSHLKPTDAIVVAGAGSTSTLHRDPFEWTGTSLCLEGTKIWRFIYPPLHADGGVSVVDAALESYRLDSVAWEENETTTILSAGWQSNFNLCYSIGDEFHSAIEWMKLQDTDQALFRKELEVKTSLLSPCADTKHAFDRISRIASEATFATAIQHTGDLLLIPAYCWHQTYAPVPSVAVASQRCSASVDGSNVVGHILGLSKNVSNLPDILRQPNFREGSGRDVVETLLRFVLK